MRKLIVDTFMTLDGVMQAPRGPDEGPTSEEPAAAPLNNATKYVASTTLTSVAWQNSQPLEGPLADSVNAVKAQDGPDIHGHGSANLVQSLHAETRHRTDVEIKAGSFVQAELDRRAAQGG